MVRFDHPDTRARLDPRVRLLAVITAVVAGITLLQWTTLAPLPHAADGFLGGLTASMAMSLFVGWLASR